MKCNSTVRSANLLLLPVLLLLPLKELCAQDKMNAFQQALAQNQKRLRQYRWVETTIISLKGEEKSRSVKQCFYGPDGKVQKQVISAPPPQKMPGGLRGKIAANKKEEVTDYMNRAVNLVHQYIPPNPELIQGARASGNVSLTPGPAGLRLDLRNFLKPNDLFSLTVDTKSLSILKANVNSYMDDPKDVVTLNVTFAFLPNGVDYPGNIVLQAPEKKIQVVVQNSNYYPVK